MRHLLHILRCGWEVDNSVFTMRQTKISLQTDLTYFLVQSSILGTKDCYMQLPSPAGQMFLQGLEPGWTEETERLGTGKV